MGLARRNYYYQATPKNDDSIIMILTQLAGRHIRWGFDKVMKWMRKQGYGWNHKRVHRVYCELGLNLRVKPKKRLPSREPVPLQVPARINDCWSIDFMHDALRFGRRFKALNILDDHNREGLAIDVAYSIPAARVTQVLDCLIGYRGKPNRIRVDNGPEFIAHHFQDWAKAQGIHIDYIEPGKPAQNAYIERFNRTYREDILDAYWFDSLSEVKRLTDKWLITYNEERPHQSLNDMTPIEYITRAA